MKPCSAWCKPEEGVHVVLDRMKGKYEKVTIREARLAWEGQVLKVKNDRDCLPPGTLIEILAVDLAEADPMDWDLAVSITQQVLV